MHYEAHKAVTNALRHLPLERERPVDVIEIGSLDINGSVRSIFKKSLKVREYVGVDVGPGKGVDMVCSGDEVDLPANSFDIAISTECFEHNPKWRETFANMHRMLKANGLMIMTCAATGRPEHGTVNSRSEDSPLTQSLWPDYYRNLNEDDFKKNFRLDEMFSCYRFYYNPFAKDLYFIGYKASDDSAQVINLDLYRHLFLSTNAFYTRKIWYLFNMILRKLRGGRTLSYLPQFNFRPRSHHSAIVRINFGGFRLFDDYSVLQ